MASPTELEDFFESLSANMDIHSPLRWGFLLSGAPENRVSKLMDEIRSLGFTEVEPMFDEDAEGQYILYLAEVCVHTIQSYADRLTMVEQLAIREGLVVSDSSAGILE